MENLTVQDYNRKAFAARLSEAMGDMTNRALAVGVGVSATSINEYCAGSRFPGADVAWDIACFLNVSADWLIGGKGPMRPEEAPSSQPPASAPPTAPVSIYDVFGPAANEEGEESVLPRSIINFCAMAAGFAFELSKAQGWLRDLKPDEFTHLTEGIIEMESRTCLPDPSYRPSVAAYKKMLKLMNR